MELFLGGSLVVTLILGIYLWKSVNRLYRTTRASITEKR